MGEESGYYNNDTVANTNGQEVSSMTCSPQEMPEVPDVRILHCGEQPHHKMGIKVAPKTSWRHPALLHCNDCR